MLLPMLRAVSKMLDRGSPEVLPMAQFEVQVRCGKVILDELITNLQESLPTDIIQVPITAVIERPNPVSKEKTPATKTAPEAPHPPKEPLPEVETKGDEWLITVDENKNLVIKDFPPGGMVELDGKKMQYSETKGIQFKKARIL